MLLSRLLIRDEEKGLVGEFKVGRNGVTIPLVHFANNTILFSRATLEELENLKIILLIFRQLSDLKINLEKCTISGINVEAN